MPYALSSCGPSNHVHLLVLATEDMEAIPRMMQLVAGRVAQIYNRNRHRHGFFWEKRYQATAVQSDYLGQCSLYSDLNMVRAKKVKHPSQWETGGYQEIVSPKTRYRIINRKDVARLLHVEENDLSNTYQGWIRKALRGGYLSRDTNWSSGLAVGDEEFVRKIKESQRRSA